MKNDLAMVYLKCHKFEALKIAETGVTYGERVIPPTEHAQTIIALLETSRNYQHASLKYLSLNLKLCKSNLKRFMIAHDTKVGHVSSKNRTKNNRV